MPRLSATLFNGSLTVGLMGELHFKTVSNSIDATEAGRLLRLALTFTVLSKAKSNFECKDTINITK